MPIYNAAPTVARALESVLSQTRPADEVIVVDDGSRDDGAAIARKIGGSRITVLRQANAGPASARNAGIGRATGDVVALLDADDSWDSAKLSRQIEVFERHPAVVATASDWGWDEDGRHLTGLKLSERLRRRAILATPDDLLRIAFSMTASTVAVRRPVLARHRFDERLETAEDRDVWVRVASEGHVWFDDAVLTTVARRPDSQSNRNVDRDCANMIEVLRRYADRVSPSEMRRWEARTYSRWAGGLLAAGRPDQAMRYAWERSRREWGSPVAWWILAKCGWQAVVGAGGR